VNTCVRTRRFVVEFLAARTYVTIELMVQVVVSLSVCFSLSITDVPWLTGRSYGRRFLHEYLAMCLKPRHAKFQ